MELSCVSGKSFLIRCCRDNSPVKSSNMFDDKLKYHDRNMWDSDAPYDVESVDWPTVCRQRIGRKQYCDVIILAAIALYGFVGFISLHSSKRHSITEKHYITYHVLATLTFALVVCTCSCAAVTCGGIVTSSVILCVWFLFYSLTYIGSQRHHYVKSTNRRVPSVRSSCTVRQINQ